VCSSDLTVIVTNAHLWHGGTRNRSGARRRMLHLSYTPRSQPQQLDQQANLTPALFNRLDAAQRYLFDVRAPAKPLKLME